MPFVTPIVMRRLVAAVSAVVLTGVMASSVRALDGCKPVLSAEPEAPACCKKDTHDRISDEHRDCCDTAALAEHDPGTTVASPTPDVPGAPVVTLPLALLEAFASPDSRACLHLARDGPPDRRPPTNTTVLLI
jgi:hypothetical protein